MRTLLLEFHYILHQTVVLFLGHTVNRQMLQLRWKEVKRSQDWYQTTSLNV